MKAQNEAVQCIYNGDGELIAIVKRDDKSRKVVVYMAQEASVEQVAALITNNEARI